jgi:histone deacetylase complex regulatory component SIN3
VLLLLLLRLQVRRKFSPEVYAAFLSILYEYKEQCIDMAAVMTRVHDLFTGHPDFIAGFNAFAYL